MLSFPKKGSIIGRVNSLAFKDSGFLVTVCFLLILRLVGPRRASLVPSVSGLTILLLFLVGRSVVA